MKFLWEHEGSPPFDEDPPDIEGCHRFPIWTMEETDWDGNFDVPIQVTDPLLIGEEDGDAALMLFVFCSIQLADGSKMDGVVYLDDVVDPEVRGREYHLHVFCEGGEAEIRPKEFRWGSALSLEEFAQRLGRPLDQITPLAWTTAFRIRILDDRYPTGISTEYPLAGQIDLLAWE